MGTVVEKLTKNIPGKYAVTSDCDGCAYCAMIAPDNFDFDKPTNTYYIFKQPGSSGEEELVVEAMEDCPVGAIVSDN